MLVAGGRYPLFNCVAQMAPRGSRAALLAVACAAACWIGVLLEVASVRARCRWKRFRTALQVRLGNSSRMIARHLKPCLRMPCRKSSSSSAVHGSSAALSRTFSSTGLVRRTKRLRTDESLRPCRDCEMSVQRGPTSETRRRMARSSSADQGSCCGALAAIVRGRF